MFRIIILIIATLLLACEKQDSFQKISSSSVYDESITHINLAGNWQGKWDDIYNVKFEIVTLDEESGFYQILYIWQEQEGGGLSESARTGKAINENTILSKDIYIRINPYNKNRAIAFGAFSKRTRIAHLIKLEN